jgi:hypothetical protein
MLEEVASAQLGVSSKQAVMPILCLEPFHPGDESPDRKHLTTDY